MRQYQLNYEKGTPGMQGTPRTIRTPVVTQHNI